VVLHLTPKSNFHRANGSNATIEINVDRYRARPIDIANRCTQSGGEKTSRAEMDDRKGAIEFRMIEIGVATKRRDMRTIFEIRVNRISTSCEPSSMTPPRDLCDCEDLAQMNQAADRVAHLSSGLVHYRNGNLQTLRNLGHARTKSQFNRLRYLVKIKSRMSRYARDG